MYWVHLIQSNLFQHCCICLVFILHYVRGWEGPCTVWFRLNKSGGRGQGPVQRGAVAGGLCRDPLRLYVVKPLTFDIVLLRAY